MKVKETLKFYTIDEEYIEYLSKFDEHVSWNKEQKRPYIGIVLIVEEHLYFAPLYSYKSGYDRYKENPSFIQVFDDISVIIKELGKNNFQCNDKKIKIIIKYIKSLNVFLTCKYRENIV